MLRNIIIGVSFLSFLFSITPGAFGADDLLGQAIMGFRYPDYDNQGQLKMEVSGDKARFLPQDLIQITNLRMTFYEEGKMVMHISTPLCFFNRVKQTATSKSEVRVTRAEVIITGRGFDWDKKDGLIRINQNARVILQKDGQKSYLDMAAPGRENSADSPARPAAAKRPGETGSATAERGTSSGAETAAGSKTAGSANDTNSTFITSSKLTYDSQKSAVVFEGSVVVTDPDLKIQSERLTVVLSNDKKVESIAAEGSVVITRNTIQATSQMALYTLSDGKIALSGKPNVTRQKDTLTAETIVLWRNSNRIICEPHAHLIIYSERNMQDQAKND